MRQQATPTTAQDEADQPVIAAIIAAETRTAAEIAVAVLPRAERYTLTSALAAALTCAVLYTVFGWIDLTALIQPSTLGSGAWLEAMPWASPAIALAVAIIVFLLCEWSALGARLTPHRRRHQACRTKTRLVFLDQRIDMTEDRLGLLICVYEAERQIEILPDRGVAAVLPEERWQALIDLFRQHKRGEKTDVALARLVTAVADDLAPHFPPRAGQKNELPDRPIRL